MVQTLDRESPADDPGGAFEDIPSTRLRWDGAVEEQLVFMRAVYDRQRRRAASRRPFVADIPEAELGPIEGGQRARTQAARACRSLLQAARADLAQQQVAGGAAGRVGRIGVASGYRSASRQFENWQRSFPRYYAQTQTKRAQLPGGEHGVAAVDFLAGYVGGRLAAPGYSLHNDGLAIDFSTREGGEDLGPSTADASIAAWRRSWLFAWLSANAAGFNFHENTSIQEPWHWEYRAPPTADQERESAAFAGEAIPEGRVELAGLSLLRGHRGVPPDLILRWNAMPDVPATVDVVVHLHGYSRNAERMSLTRDKEPHSGLDFADPDSGAGGAPGRTRPTLAVLPRGNYFGGRTGMGFNFPALVSATGLRELITVSLSHFGHAVGAPNVRMARLILTAHSGGGAALMKILRHIDPEEVHVFDGLYSDASDLSNWARERIRRDAAALAGRAPDAAEQYLRDQGGALRVFFRPTTKTESYSMAVHRAVSTTLASRRDARAVLVDRYRVERTSVGHGEMPRRFGWRLLADATARVPGARSAGEALDDEDSLEAPPTATVVPSGLRILLTIQGASQGSFKGEAASAPRGAGAGAIEAIGFSYGVTVPHTQQPGQAVGRRRHGDVIITKLWGAATPQVFQALTTNENLPSVQMGFWRPDQRGGEVLYHVVRLRNARVSGIKHYVETPSNAPGSPLARGLEEVSFNFQEIEIENVTAKTVAVDSSTTPGHI